MDALERALSGIVDHELARARQLADDETWNGPKADAVRQGLLQVHRMLCRVVDECRLIGPAAIESGGSDLVHSAWLS